MDSGRLEAVAPGAVHLDTVRALHQTVVSLRTALEVSKNELKELKEKYEQHSRCIEYSDLIEKLTIENHILRRKIIDSGFESKEHSVPNIKLEITCSPRQNVEEFSEVVIHTATTDRQSAVDLETDREQIPERIPEQEFCASERLNERAEGIITTDVNAETIDQEQSPEQISDIEGLETGEENLDIVQEELQQEDSVTRQEYLETGLDQSERERQEEIEEEIQPNSQVTSYTKPTEEIPASFKTRLELLSKFDVRIKVRTLKDGVVTSSTTSDSDSTIEEEKSREKKTEKESKEGTDPNSFYFEEKRKHFENAEDSHGNKIKLKAVSSENIKMAVPNETEAKYKVDKFDVKVRITSEENLVVKENVERSRRKDTLNFDVDNLSLKSFSEGDNSVFSEAVQTPLEPEAAPGPEKEPDGSGNESEEVDDIELIFTTDESKDISNLQEDLVSIREAEQWAPASATSVSSHSTPVLIKFHTLDPDFQPGGDTYLDNENQENNRSQELNESQRMKRVSLPSDKDIRNVSFNGKSLDLPGRGILKSCDNKSDNMLYKKSPSASARKLDSVDSLTCEYNRGMSFDTTKSSSFEMGSSMEILQRDESVDSFQKTGHLGHRFSVFVEPDISKCGISEEDLSNLNVRRNTCPNPFQYRPSTYRGGGVGVSRALGPFKASGGAARARPVLRDPCGPRRDSGAQTDVSALPPRWGSDGYLAYKMAPPVAPTLPGRTVGASRRPALRDARPPPPTRRSDETRRVLLSDIGFTSMVPELSRSADPVWVMAKRAVNDSEHTTASTSKYLSRGSSQRSPSLSVDRGWMDSEWARNLHLPPHKRDKLDIPTSRYSMPDVRCPLLDYETELLLKEADSMLRTSLDDLHDPPFHLDPLQPSGTPFVPSEPRHLKPGYYVKVITPTGRIALGRVRYVGYAGPTAAQSGVMVGAEFPVARTPGIPRNDGVYAGRRYFHTPIHYNALFVPFGKVVMAWQ